jgi:hypothetical protein
VVQPRQVERPADGGYRDVRPVAASRHQDQGDDDAEAAEMSHTAH